MFKEKKHKKRKLCIIGHFGKKQHCTDGQTIKTRILYSSLREQGIDIIPVDTAKKNINPVGLAIDSIIAFSQTDKIIVLLSGNGMKTYFPILYLLSKYAGKNIYHDVIGGNLDKYVSENRNFKKYLCSFSNNWVEIKSLKDKLNKLGISNVEVIPNFKRLKISDLQINKCNGEPFVFCTFSRVVKEKGIEDAVEAIVKVNRAYKRQVCRLDIYGEIDKNYASKFFKLIKDNRQYVKYCGVIRYESSTDILKKYYALLFPTFWQGEGLPGTIIDSFAAGLPVIATDWNYNREIIESGKTGIVYRQEEGLYNVLMNVMNDTDNFYKMRKNCIQEAKKYLPDMHIKKIINEIWAGE